MRRNSALIAVTCLSLMASACSDSGPREAAGDTENSATGSGDAATDEAGSGTPDCRADEPISGDWCEVSGTMPPRGSVRVTGPLVPMTLHPEGARYTVRVPLGVHADPEITVETLDSDGDVTDTETIPVRRDEASGSVQVSGYVRARPQPHTTIGRPIAGADVTIAGRTVTTNESGHFEFGAMRVDDDGQYVFDESGEPIIDHGVPENTDLIHLAADGHIGRLDSIEALRSAGPEDAPGPALPSTETQLRLDVQLDPLGRAVPVRRGDAEVRLSDRVRIQFGPDGAPDDASVRLTEQPATGTALAAYGAGYLDISALTLGPEASLQMALADDAASAGADDGSLPVTLWEPTTATRRTVEAHVADGELVLPLEEIRGEVIWVGVSVGEIHRTVIDTEERITQEHVPSALRECGQPLAEQKVTHVAEWEPESTSKDGETVLMQLGHAERPERIALQFHLGKGEMLASPRVFVKRTLERARYEFVSRFDPAAVKHIPGSRLHDLLPDGFEPFERLEMVDAAFSDADGNELATTTPSGDLKPVTDCDLEGRWLRTTGSAPLPMSELSRKVDIIAVRDTKPRKYKFKSDHKCGTDLIELTQDTGGAGSGQTYVETNRPSWTCAPTDELCCEFNPTTWTLDATGVLHRVHSGTDYGHVLNRPYAKEFVVSSTWARR